MDDRTLVPMERTERDIAPVDFAYVRDVPEDSHKGMGVFTVVLRRWRLVLLSALVVCVVGMPLLWLLVKPRYTAISAIEVSPVVPWIAFQEDSQPIPFYTNYIRTQAALIKSTSALYQVLEDPAVRKLDYLKEVRDPVMYLQDNLNAVAGHGSQLLLVSMAGDDPVAVTEIVNAAVRAYMRVEGGSEASYEDKKLRTLETERESSSEKLRSLYEAAYKLGEEFGTTDLTAREEILLSRVQALQEQLTDVESALIMAQAQQQILEAKESSGLSPSDLVKLRSDSVANDPVVSAFTLTVIQMETDYALAGLERRGNSAEMERKHKALDTMKKALADSKTTAEKHFDEVMEKQLSVQKNQSLEDMKTSLFQLGRRKARIQELLDEQNSKVIELGRKGLAISKLQDEIALTKDLYQTLKQRIQVLRVERQRPARVRVAYEAETPRGPSRDKRVKYSVVLVLGALLFGTALAVFLQQLDARVEKPVDVESELNLKVLGTIPRFQDLDHDRIKPKHFIDDCRTIRVNLTLGQDMPGGRVLVLASPQGRDGKTTLAINLATSIALTGKNVLLVDGDLRKPDIARYLRLDNSKGLNNVLAGQCSIEEAVQGTRVSTLHILPCNRSSQQKRDLLADSGLLELLAKLRARYDEIVIDTPAVLAMPDAKLWARFADGVVLVARSGKTGANDLIEAKARFGQVGANILGAVLTGVRMRDSYERYGHRYGHGYVDEPLTEAEWDAAKLFLLSRAIDEDEEEEDETTGEEA
ncbi:MAG: polysaccharide biosynthesis tyrosine autokinase [Planctomycetes bacterium]|nr:polysaccharide biosynthesis tyrosine autokinase [Planctomycetota bacterium]